MLKEEHRELHAKLVEALAQPGDVGAAARIVADLLHPHFEKEEAFALPPLGILDRLSSRSQPKFSLRKGVQIMISYSMKTLKSLTIAAGLVAAMAFAPRPAEAHCDTLDGPVVAEAKAALDQGDITPVLKWISANDEKAVRSAFAQTLAVRKQGPEARELADRYFFETLVRIHRAGEGAPYTGLKPGVAIDPAVALADKALESGSVDQLVEVLTGALEKGIRDRFARAHESQKHAKHNVAAGREFVESYVTFTHYVEGLHSQISHDAAHHGEDASHAD